MVKRKASLEAEDATKRPKAIATPLPAFLTGDSDNAVVLPRGKTETTAKIKPTKTQTEDQGIFQLTRPSKKATPQPEGSDSEDDDIDTTAYGESTKSVVEKEIKSVHQLKLKNLGIGNIVLGAIKSITEFDMVISLPDGLTGFVSLREVSDSMANIVDDFIAKSEQNMNDDTDALPSLSDMYSVGDLVRVVVVNIATADSERKKADNPNRIELSMRPSLVNTHINTEDLRKNTVIVGAVKSSEAKGYILDIGIPNMTAFLPKTETTKKLYNGMTIEIQLTQTATTESRALTATCKFNDKAVLGLNSDVSLNALKPGTLLKVSVVNQFNDGLHVRFLTSILGTISLSHLAEPLLGSVTTLVQHYNYNTQHVARVLFVNPLTKQVLLSLRKDIVQNGTGTVFSDAITTGMILKNTKIIRTMNGDNGALLHINESLRDVLDKQANTKPLLAYVHRNETSDTPLTSGLLPKHIKAGKTLDVRVLGFNPMEGYVIVSAKPSVVASDVFNIKDITPGKLITAVVESFIDKVGLIVRITGNITAIVPLVHLRDGTYLKSYTKVLEKYPVGKTAKFRVLSVDQDSKKVVLTAKPALLKTDAHIVSSLDQVNTLLRASPQGILADGFVVQVSERHVVVNFFNEIRGTCTVADMIRNGVIVEGQSPTEAYEVGQYVRVRITQVKEENKKVLFTFNITMNNANISNILASKTSKLPIGAWVSANITGVLPEDKGLTCEITYNNQVYDAVLPTIHLSDTVTNTYALLQYYASTKPTIPIALVIAKKDKIVITIKPLFLAYMAKLNVSDITNAITLDNISEYASVFAQALSNVNATVNTAVEKVVQSTGDVHVNDVIVGNVSKITDFGVFIRSTGGFTALAPKAELADTFVENNKEIAQPGQTVFAMVKNIVENGDEKRVEVSIKTSVVGSSMKEYVKLYNLSYFAELALLNEHGVVPRSSVSEEDATYVAPKVAVGTIYLDTQVKSVSGNVVTLKAPKSTTEVKVLNQYHIAGSSIADAAVVGATAGSRVIYNDPVTGEAVASLKPVVVDALVTSSKKKEHVGVAVSTTALSLKSGDVVDVQVLHVGKTYTVVGLVDHKYSLAYTLNYNTNVSNAFTSYITPGHTMKAIVATTSKSITTPLIVSLQFDSVKKSGIVIPDGVYYSATNLNDFQLGQSIKVRLGSYDSDKNVFPVYFGPESSAASSYKDLVIGTASLSSIMDLDMSAFTKRTKKPVVQSVIEYGNKLAAEESVLTAKIIRTSLSPITVTIPGNAKKALRQMLVNVSVRPTDVEQDNYTVRSSIEEYEVGSVHLGTITNITPQSMIVEFTPNMYASIRSSAITNNADLLNNLDEYVSVGDVIRVKITYNDLMDKKEDIKGKCYVYGAIVHTVLNPKGVDSNTDYKSLSVTVGNVINNGIVTRYDAKKCQYIVTCDSYVCRLPFSELSDIFTSKTDIFNIGDTIPSLAVLAQIDNKTFIVSIRESRISAAMNGTLDCPEGFYNHKAPQPASEVETFDPMQVSDVLSFKDVAAGQLLHGYITAIEKYGVFIQLSGLLTGRILLKNLTKGFISDASKHYSIGQLLSVRVLSVDNEKASIELTAKQSEVSAANLRVLNTLKPGMVVKGTVNKVTELGVFITLKHCDLHALAHKSECVDNKNVDYTKHYSIGDKVKAVVLRVDKAKQRIAIGLRASLFTKLDEIARKGRSKEESLADAETAMTDDAEEESLVSKDLSDDSEDESSEDEYEHEDATLHTKAAKSATASSTIHASRASAVEAQIDSAPSLFASLVFPQPANDTAGNDDDDDDEEELVPMFDENDDEWIQSAKQRKEAEIERVERAIMDENRPETSEDFEMQCVRNPNNSYVWVQYMAHELTQGNIVQAREIAERALKSISVHASQERWNVWSAMLSLENVYGNEASMTELVKRAQKLNNPLNVQLELARIYELSSKIDKADETYSVAAKKWGSDFSSHAVDIWVKWFTLLFTNSRVEDARKVLATAIQKLPTKQHATVIIRFSQLEFHNPNGSSDRARMLLEQFLSNNTKRLDVWMVFIDQEIKYTRTIASKPNVKPGDVKKAKGRVRTLFDRITAEAYWKVWTTKQMKFIFKKYIDFEDQLGSANRVATVQDKARLYVSSVTTD